MLDIKFARVVSVALKKKRKIDSLLGKAIAQVV